MPPIRFAIALALALAFADPALATPLIADTEARLPPPTNLATAGGTRSVLRGPSVRLVAPQESPADVAGQFWFRVEFRGHGGVRINPDQVTITYLRAWEVDLTPRLRPFITASALEVRDAEVPPGVHYIRIEVQDTQGRSGALLVQLRGR